MTGSDNPGLSGEPEKVHSDSKMRNHVTTSIDADDLAQAKELGRLPTLDELTDFVASDEAFSVPVGRAAQRFGPALKDPLAALMADDTQTITARFRASRLLGQAGVMDWQASRPLLEHPSADIRRRTLSMLKEHPCEEPERLLELTHDPDSRVRETAWTVAAGLKVEGWEPALAKHLVQANDSQKRQLCRLLSQAGHRGIMDLIEGDEVWQMECWGSLLRHPKTAQAAAIWLRKKGSIAAARLLAGRESLQDVELYRHSLAKADPYTAQLLLLGLIRALGPGAKEDILEALRQPSLLGPALAALKAAPLDLKQELLQLDVASLNFSQAFDLAWVLIELGVHDQKQLQPILAKVLRSSQADLDWKRRGWTPNSVLERLRELEVIPGGPPGQTEGTGRYGLYEMLEELHHLYLFDTELGSPPDYVSVLDQLEAISQGHFRPTSLHQQLETDSEGCQSVRVQFLHDGRLYRYWLEVQDDWADTGNLLRAPNQALEDSESALRFRYLYSFGQEAVVLCAEPAAVERAVEQDLLSN